MDILELLQQRVDETKALDGSSGDHFLLHFSEISLRAIACFTPLHLNIVFEEGVDPGYLTYAPEPAIDGRGTNLGLESSTALDTSFWF